MASIRHLLVRAANADIAESARQFHWDVRTPVPFLCECDADGCQAHVRLTLDQYEELAATPVYVTAAGHAVSDAMPVGDAQGFALYASVA